LRRTSNEQESAIYYARIVMEHPLSDRVDDATRQLKAIGQPIPEPNPVALARAQQAPRDDKGVLGKMFGMFKSRPAVPTEPSAASSTSEAEPADTGAAPARGSSTSGTTGASPGGNNGNGTFTIDPTKVESRP